jgi:hypothetical protein
VRNQPNPEQPDLFERDQTAIGEVFREQLAKVKSESERVRVRAQIEALTDSPASGTGSFWNGHIWVSDSDVPF